MNFNASRNVGGAGGIRKAKRVSDVNAMGAPSPPPAYSSAGYDPGVYSPPPPQPTHFQEGITVGNNTQAFAASMPNNNVNFGGNLSGVGTMPTVAQLGSVIQTPIMQDMALQYGQQLASHGRQVVHREIEKYVPVTKLRYYFAVDTRYVLKKILLIFFPFTHKEWSVKYDQDSPVQPRYDLNAPDLYIPSMAYITYILLAGFMLGLQQRFSPEQIGTQASRALAYIVLEMGVYTATLYVTQTASSLKTLDLLAFSGYKYAVMIGAMLAALLLSKTGYYATLVYASCTLSYFLVKTLRVQVLSGGGGGGGATPDTRYGYGQAGYGAGEAPGGTKRRLYFLLFVAITQPLLSWWLTYDLVPSPAHLASLANK